MTTQLKIMIADDHPLVRKHIKQLISDEFGKVQFGEASEGREAMGKIRESIWDLVILDVSMPSKNGLEIVSEMRKEKISTPVVMISMHSADDYAPTALRAGANAYIEKSNSAIELVRFVKELTRQ